MPSLWPVLWIHKSCVNICKALNTVPGTIFRHNIKMLLISSLIIWGYFFLFEQTFPFFPCLCLSRSTGALVPAQGSNSGPLHWECRALATGPPGKSPSFIISIEVWLRPNSRLLARRAPPHHPFSWLPKSTEWLQIAKTTPTSTMTELPKTTDLLYNDISIFTILCCHSLGNNS